MTIQEVVSNLDNINDDLTVYAQSIDGEFYTYSPITLVELSDEEINLPTKEVVALKCPSFEYFMEVFLIKEFIGDLITDNPQMTPNDRVKRLIDYVKYDA